MDVLQKLTNIFLKVKGSKIAVDYNVVSNFLRKICNSKDENETIQTNKNYGNHIQGP